MSTLRQSVLYRPRRTAAAGGVAAFGTFGELLQGALPDGNDFLVTMPIARWSTATFRLDPDADTVTVLPAHKTKSLRLVRMMLDRYGVRGGGTLLLESDLPEGKGLASSSADLVATARAVGRAVGVVPGPAEIETLLRGIEPTDGVMYPGVVAFHHRAVRLRTRLGHLPRMTIVGIDEGGSVSTVRFNKCHKVFSPAVRDTYARLLDTLSAAIRSGDTAAIGRVATESARLNQRFCPKGTLDRMIAICREVGGLGVVTTHSGTALGVLLDDARPAHPERLEWTKQACGEITGSVWVDRTLPDDGRRRLPEENTRAA
ncbi:kinase [Actinophytocola oryzae]|uniref:Threonine kinase n=1 Tax=Actinophytocola oryzae TaxID=502181 RepID=A0A4R7V3H6_9PSEU|nr:kinase [Actinophytocola oryzae]TDV43157.1 threonine kinase [Actinophytocola oryzae]